MAVAKATEAETNETSYKRVKTITSELRTSISVGIIADERHEIVL